MYARRPRGLAAAALFWLLAAAIAEGPLAKPGIGPEALVGRVADGLFRSLREHRDALRADPAVADALVAELVVPHVDFDRMARAALGRHARTATGEQLRRYSAAYRSYLTSTYTRSMVVLADEILAYEDAVTILPLRGAPEDGDVTIPSRIEQPDGEPPVRVDYRLIHREQGWKLVDVSIEGISFLLTQRQTFGEMIRRDGLDAFIQALEGGAVAAPAPALP